MGEPSSHVLGSGKGVIKPEPPFRKSLMAAGTWHGMEEGHHWRPEIIWKQLLVLGSLW